LETTKKAYELRERLSEPEKLSIESQYYFFVTGDLQKAREAYEVWAHGYPRSDAARNNLGLVYQALGQYDKNLTECATAFGSLQKDPVSYSNLVNAYLYLNRLDDAQATAEDARAKKLDGQGLHEMVYSLAFLLHDTAAMEQQVAWSAGKPGSEG
jgi:eukaryotic-like serine/threonine-protein kinase